VRITAHADIHLAPHFEAAFGASLWKAKGNWDCRPALRPGRPISSSLDHLSGKNLSRRCPPVAAYRPLDESLMGVPRARGIRRFSAQLLFSTAMTDLAALKTRGGC
jgi:hypothetical protein